MRKVYIVWGYSKEADEDGDFGVVNCGEHPTIEAAEASVSDRGLDLAEVETEWREVEFHAVCQYEYKLTSKANGHQYTQYATAKTEQEAYEAVHYYYANGFDIEREPIKVRPAHEVFGEINCM